MTSVLAHAVAFLTGSGTGRPARALVDAALRVAPRDMDLLRKRVSLAVLDRDMAALARAFTALISVCPDDAELRRDAATLALIQGRIEDALQIVSGSPHLHLLTDSLIDPDRAQREEGAYVAVLNNVLVETDDWSVIDGDKVYNAEAHRRKLVTSCFVKGRTSPDRSHFLFELPPESHTIEEPCVYLGGDANYAHWIQRNLLKLALLEGTAYETLPLLINDDLRPHQHQFLAMLGIPKERLVRVPRPTVVRCRQLVLPTNLVYSPRIGIGVQWLRRKLAPWMDPGPPRDLVYLSRADAKARRVLNEPELEAALHALGFYTVTAGALSVEEQIRALSRARVIVGVHGASFGNLVFAPAGAWIIEINSTKKAHMTDFLVLARAVGLRQELVLSDHYGPSPPEGYSVDADFSVDVGQVLKVTLAALRSPLPST